MPRIGETGATRRLYNAFVAESFWKRSRKGNLWREWEGETVTVYAKDGGYSFVVADSDGPTFSDEIYDTEADAIEALAELLLED